MVCEAPLQRICTRGSIGTGTLRPRFALAARPLLSLWPFFGGIERRGQRCERGPEQLDDFRPHEPIRQTLPPYPEELVTTTRCRRVRR